MPTPKNKVTNAKKQEPATRLDAGLSARVIRAMQDFGTERNGTDLPKDGLDRRYAEMFMWDMIASMAKKRSDQLWEKAEGDEVIQEYKELDPGVHTIGEGDHFVVNCTVSERVHRFDPAVLADKLLKSKYRVPIAETLQRCEQAKVPKNSNRVLKVVERIV